MYYYNSPVPLAKLSLALQGNNSWIEYFSLALNEAGLGKKR